MSLAAALPAALLLGYLLGSLSPSCVLGRLLRNIDVREVNFRNAGVRNVKATPGFWPAALTAVIDLGKGVAAVLLSQSRSGGSSHGRSYSSSFPSTRSGGGGLRSWSWERSP
jgi:glycerol-3-phosphate acyltransferase PlsY